MFDLKDLVIDVQHKLELLKRAMLVVQWLLPRLMTKKNGPGWIQGMQKHLLLCFEPKYKEENP